MFSFIKKMWWFISKHKAFYIIILVLGLIQALTLLIPADIVGDFTDKIDNNTLTKDYLIYNIVLKSFFTCILIYLINTIRRCFQVKLRMTLFYALQVRYMENILVQDASFFEKYQAGDLLNRAIGDVKSVNFSGGNRLLNITYEATSIIIYVIAMALINPLLTLYSVLPLALIFVTNLLLKMKVQKNWKEVRNASSLMSNVVLESITNVYTIRAFSKEEENYKKNLEYSKKTYDIERKNLFINTCIQPIFQSIIAISLIIAYFYAIDKIPTVNGKTTFTLAMFTQFIIYLNSLAAPFRNIGNMLTNFYQSIISQDRLNEIYDSKTDVLDKNDASALEEINSIEFRDISFKYPNDKENVLNNINFTISKGETLGIVGKTGSGKSTLIRQLLRQFPVSQGDILINGISINDYTKESIRRHVSYVPQESTLFTRSVLENVKLGSTEKKSEDEINNAIVMADFKKDIENLSNGLDTIVGEYGVTLSGGQKQRLSIARALLKNSDLLILDDSLSAVDGKTESNIISNLGKIRENKTNIIIAHRLSAVMNASKIIVLDNGKISECGTHEELMRRGGWYKDLFNHQLMSKEE